MLGGHKGRAFLAHMGARALVFHTATNIDDMLIDLVKVIRTRNGQKVVQILEDRVIKSRIISNGEMRV